MKPAFFNRKALEDIQRRCLDLGARKSHDYGANGDAIAMGGPRGVVIRMLDKQMRLLSLTSDGFEPMVSDESLKDTAMDQINYATYLVSLLEGTWGGVEQSGSGVGVYETQADKAIRLCIDLHASIAEGLTNISPGTEWYRRIEDAAIPDLPF
jgi:hypothetical protein